MKKYWAAVILAVLGTGCDESRKSVSGECGDHQVVCNGACHDACQSGYSHDANCTCVPVCTESNQVVCGGKCIKKCPGNLKMNDDCTCPKTDACEDPNQERCLNEQGVSGCYDYCGAGANSRNADCSCKCDDANKAYCGGSCVDKCNAESGASLDADCKCSCPNEGDEYWGGKCRPKCDEGFVRNDKGACVCSKDPNEHSYAIIGGKCVKCPNGISADGDTCMCPGAYCAKSNTCVNYADAPSDCEAMGATYNESKCACECASNQIFCNAKCVAKPVRECDSALEYSCEDYDSKTHWVDKTKAARCDMSTCDLTVEGTDCVVDADNHCGDANPPCTYNSEAEEGTPCTVAKNDGKTWVGMTSCTEKCVYNYESCSLCGNGDATDDGEVCDANDPNQASSSVNWQKCSEYDADTYEDDDKMVKCDRCVTIDTSACTPKPIEKCGNGDETDEGEACDGGSGNANEDRPWKACTEINADLYSGGTSKCKAGCGEVLTNECEPKPVTPQITKCYFAPASVCLEQGDANASATVTLHYEATVDEKIEAQLGVIDLSNLLNPVYQWNDGVKCSNNQCVDAIVNNGSNNALANNANYACRIRYSDSNKWSYCIIDEGEPIAELTTLAFQVKAGKAGVITIKSGCPVTE